MISTTEAQNDELFKRVRDILPENLDGDYYYYHYY